MMPVVLFYQALKIHPDNVKALFRRGQAYYHVKNWDKALDSMQQAGKLQPDG